MKIVHLVYSFNIGGLECMLVDIVNNQIIHDEINIIVINKSFNISLLQQIDKRVKIHYINRPESSKNPYYIISLNILLIRLKSHILHCHNHSIISLLLPTLKNRATLTVHGMKRPIKHLSKYKIIFSISESVKKDILERANITTVVVYNGVPLSSIKTKCNYSINSIFNIICIGRLECQIKGQHIAIIALNILKNKGIKNIQIDFIGSGNSEHYLKNLTKKYELSDQIRFLGLKNREYIYSHLKDYDLLIQPSLHEGFGLTVVEAMAAKIPVLVSNIEGPMEIIRDGQFGLFFKSECSNDLAIKILSNINNYAENNQMQKIELAFNHVRKNFDISRTANLYIDYYKLI